MKKAISLLIVLAMMFTLCVTSFAATTDNPSPEEPGTDYKISIYSTDSGSAIYVINDDGTVTFIATPLEGHTFREWKIEGDYIIVSGDLGEITIRIDPGSDIEVLACFDDETEPSQKKWVEPVSPKTGYDVLPVCAVAVVALFGTALCAKKAFEA